MSQSPISLKKAYEFAFSADSKRAAFIGGRDITVLDISTHKPLFSVRPIANPSHIDFSPDGHRLVVKGTSGRTLVLDAKTGGLLSDFRNQKEGEGDAALFTACSLFVVSVSWRGLFSVRERETGKLVFCKSYEGCQLTNLSTTSDRSVFVFSAGGHPRSPDGLTPCSVWLHRWPTSSAPAEALQKEWSAIWGLQVSPSGRSLAVVYGTPPDTFEIYDIARSRTVAQCHWKGGPGCSIAWSRDEMTLIVNGDDCFRVHALPNLTVVRELPAQYPCFVEFSPGDEFIALGSWKKSFVIPAAHLEAFGKGKSDAP